LQAIGPRSLHSGVGERRREEMEDESQTRQERIVGWLSDTPNVAVPMKSGSGFFINRGTIIRLKNGQEAEALAWLEKEGIHDGMIVSEHIVKHTPPGGEFTEKLSFFPAPEVTEAPF
jgi:hypothetical protein